MLPHCPQCRAPCCQLRTMVLELSWSRLRALWRIEADRAEFDRLLVQGDGPPEIRAQGEQYYAFGRTCPAFQRGRCLVQGSRRRPPGCADFPVYSVSSGRLIADLRCEAVRLDDLERSLVDSLDSLLVSRSLLDPRFDFLVELAVRHHRPVPAPAPPPRRRPPATGKGVAW